MKFSFNLINSFLKPKIDLNISIDLIEKYLTEVKEIGKFANDHILNIDILANRAYDLFSHYGLARELASLYLIKKNEKIALQPLSNANMEFRQSSEQSIRFKNKSGDNLNRYSYIYIKDIKVQESPDELKNLLFSLGIKPINLIVDVTNLVMVEIGQPLHAFDVDMIKGKEIIVAFANKGETIKTFDEKEYKLTNNILTIRDISGPLAIAGVKGGVSSGITNKTKNIVVESANFSEKAIRNTAFYLKIGSDAEKRFKNGVDLDLTIFGLQRFCELYKKYSKLDSYEFFDFKNPLIAKDRKEIVKCSLAQINKMLNINLKTKDACDIFEKLNFQVVKTSKDLICIEKPLFRNDINIEEDLIEEIFRLQDFDNIKRESLSMELKMPRQLNHFDNVKLIRNYLLHNGVNEIASISFVGKNDLLDFYDSSDFPNFVEIDNPVSQDLNFLRPSLNPCLLKALTNNARFSDEVNLFEIGKVYSYGLGSIKENITLGILMFNKDKSLLSQISNLRKIKSLIFNTCGLFCEINFKYINNLNISIYADNDFVGKVFLLDEKIKINHKILQDVLISEIILDNIIIRKIKETSFKNIDKIPYVKRDLSILVPKKISYKDLIDTIQNLKLKSLREIDLIDIYIDKNFKDCISYTFHLQFGASSRTITELEADKDFTKILESLKSQGVFIR